MVGCLPHNYGLWIVLVIVLMLCCLGSSDGLLLSMS